MNLNERIRRVEGLERKLGELKTKFYDADRNKNSEEKKKLDKEIRKSEKDITRINDEYNKDRQARNLDSSIVESVNDFLNRGKDIQKGIDDYSEKLNSKDISPEEKLKMQEELDKLNSNKEELKSQMFDKAMEKSGLKWKGKTIYPTMAIKKHKETLADLEAKRKELEAQKEKQKEIIETNKDRIHEQFNMAIEKYQQMLAAGKISQELFDSRVKNMKVAKAKDMSMLDNSILEIDKNIESKDKEIQELKGKIADLEAKEKIFDEYNNAYYELFGETFDKYYIDNKERFETPKEKEGTNSHDNNSTKESKAAEKDKNNIVKKEQKPKDNVVNTTPSGNSNAEVVNPTASENASEEKEEEKAKVVVTSKTSFDELYNKLGKGTITDEELSALTAVLSDKDNYDKYGITTGVFFNKARKILKYSGTKTFKNIDDFLKKSNEFSDSIKFDTSIEKEDICSHEILKSFDDASEELVSSNTALSVEKYIEKIEQYKESGNELSEKQQKMYKEAMSIKAGLLSYREALNTNSKVFEERSAKSKNSIFYNMFRNKMNTRALPEVSSRDKDEYIVNNDLFGIELNSMVNRETPNVSETRENASRTRNKDKDERVK